LELTKIQYKPLSVNQCWQGKRFKTKAYQKYEKDLLLILPRIDIPNPPYRIILEFGFSNSLSDWDNPVKPLQDILQKKYGFNDKDIHEAIVRKVLVKKGNDYLSFKLESLDAADL